MHRQRAWIRAILVLAAVWAVVAGVRWYAEGKRVTAERVGRAVSAGGFADWSQPGTQRTAEEAARREKRIREIAAMVNRLDFAERQKSREERSAEKLFAKLSHEEKSLFIDLTVRESMNRFMEALDAMPPQERKRFVEQGLREVAAGRTAEDINRAGELGPELIDRISREGMRAFFEKSSVQTKLDLAPLMEAVNETMQGLRGVKFGPAGES